MNTETMESRDAVAGQVERPVRRQYVIRYEDGAYNQGNGFPCRKEEATRYDSMREAWDKADELCDVAGVDEIDA